jgi:AbrB family looped-hinge helix DNA binding protein
MYTATISSKFQISIPKKLREEMHLKAGQKFNFILHGHTLQLVPKRNIADLRGLLSGANTEQVRDRKDRDDQS